MNTLSNVMPKNDQDERDSLMKRLLVPFLSVQPVMLEGNEMGFSYPRIIRDDNDYMELRHISVSALQKGLHNITEYDWREKEVADKNETWIPEPIDLFLAAFSGWSYFEDGYCNNSSVEEIIAFGMENVAAYFGYDGITRLPEELNDYPEYAVAYAYQRNEILTMFDSINYCGEHLYRLGSNTEGRFYMLYSPPQEPKEAQGWKSPNELFVMSKSGNKVLFDGIGTHLWYSKLVRPYSIPLDQLPCPVSYMVEGVMHTGWFSLMRHGVKNACSGNWFVGIVNQHTGYYTNTGDEVFIDGNKRRFKCERNFTLTPSVHNQYMPCVKPKIGDFVRGDFASDAYIAKLNYDPYRLK